MIVLKDKIYSSALNRGSNVATKFDAAKSGFDLTENLYLDISDISSPQKLQKSRKMKTIVFTCIELLHAVTEFDARNHQMLSVIWLKNWI